MLQNGALDAPCESIRSGGPGTKAPSSGPQRAPSQLDGNADWKRPCTGRKRHSVAALESGMVVGIEAAALDAACLLDAQFVRVGRGVAGRCGGAVTQTAPVGIAASRNGHGLGRLEVQLVVFEALEDDAGAVGAGLFPAPNVVAATIAVDPAPGLRTGSNLWFFGGLGHILSNRPSSEIRELAAWRNRDLRVVTALTILEWPARFTHCDNNGPMERAMTPPGPRGLAASDCCVVLMFKSPARSKRRLAEQIGPVAREAAERLWACAYEDVLRWHGTVCFAPAGKADGEWLAEQVAGTPLTVTQRDGNLGERINYVNASLCAQGLPKQIFIGTDCPQMDVGYLERAAHLLQRHDAVLGPACDGGVVLMGASRPWPPLGDLPWSSTSLRLALTRRLAAEGWTEGTLNTLTDVDSVEDLATIAGQLDDDSRPARRALNRWLQRRQPVLGACR